MASVIVAWRGALSDGATQDELLSYIGRFAELSAEFLAPEPKLPRFSELLAAQRRQGLPERANIENIDRTISGGVVVRSDAHGDAAAFSEAAQRVGLAPETSERDADHPVIRVGAASLRGCNFRLFDPRRLYPGADRMSFVFLSCPEAPFLDGSLVTFRPAAEVAGALGDIVHDADWYVECPYVHLRYVLEKWTFQLLSWIKYFFIPELFWRGWQDLDQYEEEKAMFDELAARDGRQAAKQAGFFILIEDFRADAGQWTDTFAALRDKEGDWDQ